MRDADLVMTLYMVARRKEPLNHQERELLKTAADRIAEHKHESRIADPAAFAELLRGEINARDMSVTEAARQGGIDHGTLSSWLNGRNGPSLASALLMLDGLGLEMRIAKKPAAKRE